MSQRNKEDKAKKPEEETIDKENIVSNDNVTEKDKPLGANEEVKTSQVDKNKTQIQSMSVDSMMFTILGNARILLIKQVDVTFSSSDIPLNEIAGMNSLSMTEITEIEREWKIWVDEANDMRY